MLLGLCNLALLQLVNQWAQTTWPLIELQPFVLFLGLAMGAKALGDTIYYVIWSARKTWRYLDDYVLGDLLVHLRFAFPLACLQSWAANTYLMFVPGIRKLWLTPALGVLTWAVNRYLVEEAEDARYRPAGGKASGISAGKEQV